MSVGLIGLLDDIAAIAKVAAASLDDVAGQAAKAGVRRPASSSTIPRSRPRYVIGFAPSASCRSSARSRWDRSATSS